jgi:hypothetical protein
VARARDRRAAQLLFPAIAPHFLAGPRGRDAAALADEAFPVEDTLAAILPPRELMTAAAASDGSLARAARAARRRLAPQHAREACASRARSTPSS